LLQCGSYAVPQEVGKVGTESASFVHPVAERKDGIDAFFKKAFAGGAKPLNSSGTASTSTANGDARKIKSASPEKKPDVKVQTSPIIENEKAAEAAFARDLSAAATVKSESGAVEGDKGKARAKSEDEESGQVVLSDEDDEVVVVDSSPPPTSHSPPIMVHSSPVHSTMALPEPAEVRLLASSLRAWVRSLLRLMNRPRAPEQSLARSLTRSRPRSASRTSTQAPPPRGERRRVRSTATSRRRNDAPTTVVRDDEPCL
jgi:hypothetical protein